MSITCAELQLRATRQARGGLTAAESLIYDDDAALQIKYALQDVAALALCDEHKRGLLTKLFEPQFLAGKATLGSEFDSLFREGLRFSTFYAPDDFEEQFPYVYKENWTTLHGYLNFRRGYYAFRGGEMLAVAPNLRANESPASIDFGGTARLYAMAIPQEASGTIEIAAELETDLVDALANRLKLMAAGRVRGTAVAA